MHLSGCQTPGAWHALAKFTRVLRHVPFVRIVISLFELLPGSIRPLLWGLLAYTVLSGILELMALASLLPVIIAIVVDLPHRLYVLFPFLPKEKTLLILWLIGGTCGIIVLKGIVQALIAVALSRIGRELSRWLSSAHFRNLLLQPVRHFEKSEPSRDINRNYLLGVALPTVLVVPLFRILTELMVGAVIVVGLLIAFPLLLLPLVALSLTFYLGIRKILARFSHTLEQAVTREQEQVFSSIEALYLMSTEVKVFHAAPLLATIFSHSLKKTTEGRRWLTAIGLATQVSVEAIGAVLLFLFVGGSYLLFPHEQFLLYVGVFAVGMVRMVPVISRISVQWVLLRPFLFLMDYLRELSVPEPEPLAEVVSIRKPQPLPFRCAVSLEDITFSYDENDPIFRDFSFTIYCGEAVAVVGASGMGKTTLLKLILALEKPQKGVLRVDNTPITTEELAQRWHASVGYVPQSSRLLPVPMWQNLTLGEAHTKEEVDLQWLYYLLERLQVNDVVKQLPQGLDAVPAFLGGNFSAGQLQRLAVVRALYRKPALLVLDEPTSNLDARSEEAMLTLLQELKNELRFTLLLVTHRQAPLRLATRIHQIIKETGTPAHLLLYESPLYARGS